MAAAKENSLPSLCAVLGAREYAALKEEVAQLRREAREARDGSRTAQKLDALQQQQRSVAWSLREAELCAQLDRAQAAARDQLDKATRARRLFEREKRALQAHADELAGQMEQLRAAHAAEAQAAQEAHQQALQLAQQDGRRQQAQLEAQQAQLVAQASQLEARLAQQHANALAATRAEAAQQLGEAAAAQAALAQQYTRAEAALLQAMEELRAAQREAEVLRGRAQELQQRAEEAEVAAHQRGLETQLAACALEGHVSQLEAHLVEQAAAHNNEVLRLRDRHAVELEQIQGRFEQVMARKDDVVTRLRQQLAAATAKLSQMEDLLAG